MLHHYLRSAWRTIRRNPLYSVINIGCLAIGIAVCMTILLYVLHEHSFDRWQANAKRIFVATATVKFGDASFNSELMSYPTGPLVQQADGNVASWVRIWPNFRRLNLKNPDRPEVSFTQEENFIFADSNFFSFFSFRLLKGNPAEVLRRPYTVVLTEKAAKKYFGDKDPIGRTLRLDDLYNFEVTGIAADGPSNTDISFNLIASMSSTGSMKVYRDMEKSQTVQVGAFRTWLMLKDKSAAGQVERTLERLSIVPGQPAKDRDVYTLTALADYHLHWNLGNSPNLRYLGIFPVVAGLILLLAMVNYMSLATARAAARAREVGVRKVIGAGRGRIAGQFYTESAVFAVLSFGAGTLLFLLIRSYFFRWLQLPIDVSFLLSPPMLAFSGGLLLLVIGTAGSYPALVLSAFRPVAVLYGKMSRQRGSERVRKGFIVLQFTISMTLVLSSMIIEKELYYIRHADTGLDRENVIMIPFGDKLSHYAAFKHDIARLPGMRAVTTSHYPMYKGYDAWAVGVPGSDKTLEMHTMNVDNDFISILGLQWKERPGQEADLYDGKHLLINETAVDKLGLSGDPVGRRLKLGADEMTIAGVLKDFNYESLQTGISPLCMFVSKDTSSLWGNGESGCLLGKIAAHANIPTTVEAIRKIFRQYDKQSDFEYNFADEAFNSQYKAEDRLAGLLGLFTVITVVIACLGLFALATFSAEQRVKEIGVRKVLGASVASIGVLLSRDFLRPVLLAVLIACPLSWWLMNRWLQDFAYRTTLSWWVFFLSGLGLLCIALITVLTRSLKAGRANPIDNLRTE
jgi:putative ABC transport system permease protein